VAKTTVASPTSKRVLLWTLLVVYILNFLDRQIVGILAEPIKRDLDLSDTQIGLMTGLAFALFYTLLGLPIARYADRSGSDRVRLISVSLAIWSAMTMVSGYAQNFVQILLARIGVGIGEAGCTPAAHSLITDAVEPSKRSSAIAFYGLGIPIGSLLGLVIGGALNDAFGWRAAFLFVGLPGVLMAIALPFLLREPRRDRLAAQIEADSAITPVSSGDAFRELAASRAFVMLVIAASFTAFLSYGKGVWTTILFIRSFGLSPGQTGLALGLTLGIAGMVGTWAGGWIADRFGKADKRHILTSPAIGMAVAAPILFAGYAASDWRLCLILLIMPTLLNSFYYGPTYACVQGLVRPQTRAVASATMLFGQNLIGLGLGPLFFGILSDALKPVAGDDSVRWVLYGAAWLGLIPAYFFWRTSLRLSTSLRS
jgi:predicted MFS family arabinose efflux permease